MIDCFLCVAGYLGYIQKQTNGQPLVPDVFLRISLIEGYVDFLKVGNMTLHTLMVKVNLVYV